MHQGLVALWQQGNKALLPRHQGLIALLPQGSKALLSRGTRQQGLVALWQGHQALPQRNNALLP